MENNLKFNSQVATNRQQSERLSALGLKKETADMTWFRRSKNADWESSTISYKEWVEEILPIVDGYTFEDIIPAWSLGRLLEICGKDRLPVSFHKKGKVKIKVNHIHPTHDGRSGYNYYDSIIDCIEWLIKDGYFNKEYLVDLTATDSHQDMVDSFRYALEVLKKEE